MERTVRLAHEDHMVAVKFPMKLWYAGKPKDDWRSAGTKRDLEKYITDRALEKLGEIAFAKFLERSWGIKSKLDFCIHPGASAIDAGDLVAVEVSGSGRLQELRLMSNQQNRHLGGQW